MKVNIISYSLSFFFILFFNSCKTIPSSQEVVEDLVIIATGGLKCQFSNHQDVDIWNAFQVVKEHQDRHPDALTIDLGASFSGGRYCGSAFQTDTYLFKTNPTLEIMKELEYDAINIGLIDGDSVQYNSRFDSSHKIPLLSSNYLEKTSQGFSSYKGVDSYKVIFKEVNGYKVPILLMGISIPLMDESFITQGGVFRNPKARIETMLRETRLLHKNALAGVMVFFSGGSSFLPQHQKILEDIAQLKDIEFLAVSYGSVASPNPNSPQEEGSLNLRQGKIMGKPLVVVPSHGEGVGILTLKLKYENKWKVHLGFSDIEHSRSFTKYSSTKARKQIDSFEIRKQKNFAVLNKSLTNFNLATTDGNQSILINQALIWHSKNILSTKPMLTQIPLIAAHNPYSSAYWTERILSSGPIDESSLSALAHADSSWLLVQIMGKDLKQILENLASSYLSGESSKSNILISQEALLNSFIKIDGVQYVLNLHKPPYQRITSLLYEQKQVHPEQTFILAFSQEVFSQVYEVMKDRFILVYDKPIYLVDAIKRYLSHHKTLRDPLLPAFKLEYSGKKNKTCFENTEPRFLIGKEKQPLNPWCI